MAKVVGRREKRTHVPSEIKRCLLLQVRSANVFSLQNEFAENWQKDWALYLVTQDTVKEKERIWSGQAVDWNWIIEWLSLVHLTNFHWWPLKGLLYEREGTVKRVLDRHCGLSRFVPSPPWPGFTGRSRSAIDCTLGGGVRLIGQRDDIAAPVESPISSDRIVVREKRMVMSSEWQFRDTWPLDQYYYKVHVSSAKVASSLDAQLSHFLEAFITTKWHHN